MNRRDALIIAGFVVLAAIAAAGWMRKTESGPAESTGTSAALNQPVSATPLNATPANDQPVNAQQSAYDQYGQPAAPPAMTGQYLGSLPPPVIVRDRAVQRDPQYYAPPQQAQPEADYSSDRQVYPDDRDRRDYRSYPSEPQRTRERSRARELEIIGGTAAGGAAIGALAGGGKGAAIGALSGGAAAYIYDRTTRNRR